MTDDIPHTESPYWQAPPAPRKRRVWPWVTGAIVLVIGLCLTGTIIAAQTGTTPAASSPFVDVRTQRPAGDAPAAPANDPVVSSGLRPGDVKLTVKITDKDCFGDAGCNVQWEVRAQWPPAKVAGGDQCDVTYEVRGLTDTQTSTITLRDDGTYDTGTFDFGQTNKRTDKIIAKATSVECAL